MRRDFLYAFREPAEAVDVLLAERDPKVAPAEGSKRGGDMTWVASSTRRWNDVNL